MVAKGMKVVTVVIELLDTDNQMVAWDMKMFAKVI